MRALGREFASPVIGREGRLPPLMILPLSGAEKSRLRGRGQLLEPMLKIGREAASPSVVQELDRLLNAYELVKVQFTAADRTQRSDLHEALATATGSACVGNVGATALFYRARTPTQVGES